MEKFERTHSAQELQQMREKHKDITLNINIPTCGRIVNYYPNTCDKEVVTLAGDCVPAIILDQNNDLACNMVVFYASDSTPFIMRWSIPHKSLTVPNDTEYGYKSAYWEWPKIK